MKKEKIGVIVGRFQPVHKGHQKLIDLGLRKCDRVVVFIGSSQEYNTERNPFSFQVRKDMLRILYGDRIEIVPLPDLGVGDNTVWGEYLMAQIVRYCGRRPDAMIYGDDGVRARWFKNGEVDDIEQIVLPRQKFPISATMVRDFLLNDNLAAWKEVVDEKLFNFYDMEQHVVKKVYNFK